jgi:hypothetical protein
MEAPYICVRFDLSGLPVGQISSVVYHLDCLKETHTESKQ